MESCLCRPAHRPLLYIFSRPALSISTQRPSILRCASTFTKPKANPKPKTKAVQRNHNPRASDPTTMTTTIELATVPSADTPGTCIYLHHDKRSYIFGRVGEGTQRAFGSRRIHMGGTEQVFLSGPVNWEQLGGLVGYLLSVGGAADAAREHQLVENSKRQQLGRKLLRQTEHSGVGIHGGDNLCHALATSRAVVFRQSIGVRPYEQRQDPRSLDAQNTEPDWVDDAVRVWKIPVRRSRSSSPAKRRRSSADRTNGSQEDLSKPATTLSDHNVAREIVEKIIFNGSLNNQSLLLPKKIGQLTEKDVAVTKQGSTLHMYSGPYATNGNTVPNADEDAWVFPDPKSNEPAPSYDDEGVLPVNHFPLPRTKYGELSMSYIVKCHERRGKFNPAVAKSLGVDPKDFKLLTNNQSVTVASGSTVTPEMVLGEPQPGKGIAVADVPTLDFLEPFLQRPEWTNPAIMEHVAVIYWILGADLVTNADLVKFMQDRPDIKHVLCAPNTCPNMITHPSSAEIHTRLRKVDAERFPIMTFDNKITYPAPEEDSSIELGRAGKRMTLMPRLVFDDQHIAPFADLATAFNSVDEEVIAMAEAAKAAATNPEFLARIEAQEQNIPNRDAEIVPLGTGSSVPSKHRNVSSTLIRVPGIGNYLLDCGEGTLGQIKRLYGEKETANILRNLQCIVISHVHADHHLGTTSVIKAWYDQTLADQSNAKLAISCIGRYRALLEELSQIEDIGFHRLRFPSCPYNTRDRDVTTKEDLAEYEQDFGLAGIKRIPVPHCWRSYGTELELTSGLRIAYSGDCRPSSKFAKACLGAHLLVHECTFGDDKQDHARAKNHSTMAEALRVSKEMQARRTLLTHFSQRYAKSDSLRRERDDSEEQDVLLAFDLMSVKLGDFQKAACYIPAIEKLMEKLGE